MFYTFSRWRLTDEPIKMLDRKCIQHCLNKIIYIIIPYLKKKLQLYQFTSLSSLRLW